MNCPGPRTVSGEGVALGRGGAASADYGTAPRASLSPAREAIAAILADLTCAQQQCMRAALDHQELREVAHEARLALADIDTALDRMDTALVSAPRRTR